MASRFIDSLTSFASYKNDKVMNILPFYIPVAFGLTVLLTLYIFYKASHQSQKFLLITSIWLLFQSAISLTGFYTVTNTAPPRFLLLLAPPIVCIIILFNTRQGKAFMDSLNLQTLTLLHIIRIPVEIVLFWLFIHKSVPELMTFEGRNFDILSGITAPFIYYFGFVKNRLGKPVLLIWNILCLGLLANIVISAILSAPAPFQQFAFEQPNIAILYFPFTLLPTLVVPSVLFAHLVTLRKLLFTQSYQQLVKN